MEFLHHLSLLLVLLLSSVHYQQARGFSVKKRSTDEVNKEDVKQLAGAIKVIQRAKRAALFAELRRPSWQPEDDGYYGDDEWETAYPGNGYGSYEVAGFGDLFDDDDDDDDGTGYGRRPYWAEVGAEPDAEDDAYESSDDGANDERKSDERDRGADAELVSDDELAELFAKIEQDKGERSREARESLTEALLGPAANRVNPVPERARSERQPAPGDDVKLAELSPEQLDDLIQSVEDAENEAVAEARSESGAGGRDEPTSDVSADELRDIFGDEEDNGNDGDGDDDDDDDDDGGDDDNNDAAAAAAAAADNANDVDDQEQGVGDEADAGDAAKNADEDGDDGRGDGGADDVTSDGGDGGVEAGDEARRLNKEWLIAQYLNGLDADGDVTTTKRKRSQDGGSFAARPPEGASGRRGGGGGDTADDLATELAIAREDIDVLKTFLEKEDEENANLAYALNLATKSQTDRTDKYIDEEIAYIRKAIQNEMDMQEVKDVLNIAASLDVGVEPPLSPEPFVDDDDDGGEPSIGGDFLEPNKRSRPDLAMADELDVPGGDEMDVDDDNDVNGDVTDGDLVKALLASKLHRLLKQASRNDLDKMSAPPNPPGWYDRPVLPSVEDAENESDWYLNPLLRQLWQKYRGSSPEKRRGYQGERYSASDASGNLPIDLNTLKEVLADSLNRERLSDDETCPAVQQISTYCSFINDLGLELDEEAIELCNRHEVCYTCGSDPYIGLSADDCDRNYLQEAAEICQNKKGCDVDASRLFVLMLRYHTYTQAHVPRQCSEPCTREYVAGGQNGPW